MNILIVCKMDVHVLPPVINVTKSLITKGHNVTIVAPDRCGVLATLGGERLRHIPISIQESKSFLKRVFFGIVYRRKLHAIIDEEMKNNDYIWTMTDKTVRDIGRQLYKYRHIMQLMELVDTIPISIGIEQNVLKQNIKQYAQRAYKVVVAEYNRAFIQKTIWNLDETPVVLPNRIYDINYNVECIPDRIKVLVDEMEKESRRIVLYSGGIDYDRDFDCIIKAIQKARGKYVLYIMARTNKKTEGRAMELSREDNVRFIPFIEPPYYLEITRHADIGVLPYRPIQVGNNHILNALYCAPNKIFDYAAFGLPMIGSDVPGLSIPFRVYGIGYNYRENEDSILEALTKVDNNYDDMQKNCLKYFESVNIDEIIEGILK